MLKQLLQTASLAIMIGASAGIFPIFTAGATNPQRASYPGLQQTSAPVLHPRTAPSYRVPAPQP